MQSALEMRDKTVKDVMTPIESVYMLEVSGAINRKTVKEVSYHLSFYTLSIYAIASVILLFELYLVELQADATTLCNVMCSVTAESPWPFSCANLPRHSG